MEEKTTRQKSKKETMEESAFTLPHETVYVKFIPRSGGPGFDIPGHVMWGGLADGAPIHFTVPVLSSTNKYKNVLTNAEKAYLEDILGLDDNALSVYKVKDNFWDNYEVSITKDGLELKLWNPEDYIKYKVLLANDDLIAPSSKELEDRYKATYRFVITRPKEATALENTKMDNTMACYKEFGKIESDIDTMRVLVELCDGRPYAQNSGAAFFRSRINLLIQQNPKDFLRQITDKYLHAKVILRRAAELGKVSRKGDFYYLASDNSPLCNVGEDPTLSIAAKYISQPSHYDIMGILETEVDKAKMTV